MVCTAFMSADVVLVLSLGLHNALYSTSLCKLSTAVFATSMNKTVQLLLTYMSLLERC